MDTIVRKSRYHPSITDDEWQLVRSLAWQRARDEGMLPEATSATTHIRRVLAVVDILEDQIEELTQERDEYKQLAKLRDREGWADGPEG